MNRSKQQNEPNRRVFLRTVAFGGVAAGMLAGTRLALAAAAQEQTAGHADAGAQSETRGYHESEHIREYYRKAAF